MKKTPNARWSLTRRDSLKLLAGGAAITALNPLRVLIESLADGFIRKVLAEETGVGAGARNLVSLGIFGAPPRWYWDLPLFPYSGTTDPQNAHVVTRFSGSIASGGGPRRYTDASYATHSFGGIALPHLWSSSIPTSDATGSAFGSTAMTALAQNMAILRGIRQVGDGHDFLHGKFLRPDSSGASVHGLLADRSEHYLPAVQLITNGLDFSAFFSSRLGTALANGTIGTSPLDSLVQPFRRTTANPFGGAGTSLISRRDAIAGAMNEALDIIAEAAKSAAPGSDAIYSARSKAEEFLEQGLEDFAAEFDTLRTKYMNLLRLSALAWTPGGGSISGLSDQHISTYPGDAPAGLVYNRINQSNMNTGTLIEASSVSTGDLRALIKGKATAYNASTSGAPTDTTYSNGMHEVFAVVEFLLANNYSSSINASFVSMANLDLANATFASQTYELSTTADETTRTRKSVAASVSHSFDEHAVNGGGRHISLLVCSAFYHQLATCLYQLTQAVGSSTFENTVIQVSNEFSRSPNKDGWGSEHGVYAGVASIFSGAIKSPLVVGNTTMHPSATSSAYTYYGHWGVGGLTETTAGITHLGAGHVASTLSHLLRIESPTPNYPSLLQESGGTVTSTVSSPATEVSE